MNINPLMDINLFIKVYADHLVTEMQELPLGEQ